jgi:hypothetical protein
VLEQLSEAHRKGHTSHTTDMMDTGEMSAISEIEGMDLGVRNDIMTLKNKGYGPQMFGGRDDDPPILGEASRPQKLKAVRDTQRPRVPAH